MSQITTPIATQLAQLESSSPQQRLEQLRSRITASVECVREAALIYSVMERMKDDVTQVPLNLRTMLRRVHSQLVLPEVVTNLGGRLRQKAMLLPIEDQQHLLNNGTVPFLPAVDAATIQIEAQRLTPDQIQQIFAEGHIRNIAEQRAFILQRPAREQQSARKRGRPALDLVIDKTRGGITVHGHFVPKSKLLQALTEL